MRQKGNTALWKWAVVGVILLFPLAKIVREPKNVAERAYGQGPILASCIRAAAFDNVWGAEAVRKLQQWRSTLFLRMAKLYTLEEKEVYEQHKEVSLQLFPREDAGRSWSVLLKQGKVNRTQLRPSTRVEPWGWNRYDVANPVIDCPDGNKPQRIGGDGDGGKFLCLEGILSEPGCLVYSLGSAGQFEFEQAMLETTVCQVYTFDCSYDGASLDGNKRHFYQKLCLGRNNTLKIDAKTSTSYEYLDYPTLLARLGHTNKKISLLKIDIEGYEFDTLSGLSESEGCSLPVQIAMEVHSRGIYNRFKAARVNDDDFSNLFWPHHQVSLGEIATWFGHFANLGYAIVSRENNDWSDCCAEFTLIKVEEPCDCQKTS